jgi:hypothetical protein
LVGSSISVPVCFHMSSDYDISILHTLRFIQLPQVRCKRNENLTSLVKFVSGMKLIDIALGFFVAFSV